MKRGLVAIFTCGVLLAAAITFQVNPRQWTLYGLGLKNLPKAYQPVALPSGGTGFQITFPASSSNKWAGYLLPNAGNFSLTTSDTLVMTTQLVTTGTPVFNYMSNPDNTCIDPAHFRPYIKSSNSIDWWSNPQAFLLDQSVAGSQTTLVLPLDPSQWSDVSGVFANTNAATLAYFQQSLANITAIGLTAGGGCFFSHGVNVSGGTATFQVLDIHTF